MIAFATALIVALLGDLAIVLYSKRRAPGTYLTWAEAMAAAVFAFLMFNLWYGVIPHQWITLADKEWAWRTDRIVFGPADILEPHRFIPFTVTYSALRDIVVALIYGLALSLQVFHWAQWQDRAKKQAAKDLAPVATTTYGRPLARARADDMARTDANPPMPEFRDDYVLQEVDAAWLGKAVKPKQFIHIDQSECIMCEGCVDICPWKCIHMVTPDAVDESVGVDQPGLDPSDHVVFLIDDDVCTRCALCVDRCPTGVIILGKVGDPNPDGDMHQRTNTHGYGYGMRLG